MSKLLFALAILSSCPLAASGDYSRGSAPRERGSYSRPSSSSPVNRSSSSSSSSFSSSGSSSFYRPSSNLDALAAAERAEARYRCTGEGARKMHETVAVWKERSEEIDRKKAAKLAAEKAAQETPKAARGSEQEARGTGQSDILRVAPHAMGLLMHRDRKSNYTFSVSTPQGAKNFATFVGSAGSVSRAIKCAVNITSTPTSPAKNQNAEKKPEVK